MVCRCLLLRFTFLILGPRCSERSTFSEPCLHAHLPPFSPPHLHPVTAKPRSRSLATPPSHPHPATPMPLHLPAVDPHAAALPLHAFLLPL